MQNGDQPKEAEKDKEKLSEQTTRPLFSEREKRAIVKDFVNAYISGRIKLNFVTAEERMEMAKSAEEKLTFAQALKYEINMKTAFKDRIGICCGAKEFTATQLQETIDHLFDDILVYRNGSRIEGVFTENTLESRIRDLEEGLEKTNNLVEEIVEWIYKGVTEQ